MCLFMPKSSIAGLYEDSNISPLAQCSVHAPFKWPYPKSIILIQFHRDSSKNQGIKISLMQPRFTFNPFRNFLPLFPPHWFSLFTKTCIIPVNSESSFYHYIHHYIFQSALNVIIASVMRVCIFCSTALSLIGKSTSVHTKKKHRIISVLLNTILLKKL